MPTRTVAQVATSLKKTPEEVIDVAQELGLECADAESALELDAIKALSAHFRGGGKNPTSVRKPTAVPRVQQEQHIQLKQNASSRAPRSNQFFGNVGRGSGPATVVVKTSSSAGVASLRSEPPSSTTRAKPLTQPQDSTSELKRQAKQIREEEARRREQEQSDREQREQPSKQTEAATSRTDATEQAKRVDTKRPEDGKKSTADKTPTVRRPVERVARAPKQKEVGKKSTRASDFAARRNGRRSGGLRDLTKGEDERERLPRAGGRRRTPSRPLDRVSDLAQGGDFQRPDDSFVVREVQLGESIVVSNLAQAMSVKAADLIKQMMDLGVMVTINDVLDRDTATIIVEEMGHKVKLVVDQEEQLERDTEVEGEEEPRCPVVTVMGHVDHGKTSLLDYIRKTKVASGEAGGITQHIGAYHLATKHGNLTFLDTPGHEAFSAMRARGANSTDIVVLVCAADDGVMPQTIEAVNHSKAAGVPIIVAVNKIDITGVNPERVRGELAGLDVVPEEFGGDVQFINVSAETGEGIDELLEAISVQAEVLELSAVPDASGRGLVIESKLERGRGPVVSLLVQNGTLKSGDVVLAGEYFGRVRSLMDDQGKKLKDAGPSIPIEMLGFNGTPEAGDPFSVVADERQARQLADARAKQRQDKQQAALQKSRLENIFHDLGKGEKRILNIVLKADVRGSLEAITQALANIGNEEVGVQVLGSGIGGISESDINMALTYDALVFGFNVRADKLAKAVLDRNKMDVRYYRVIYELIDDVRSMLTDLLVPEEREEILGTAEVREVFRSPRFGEIAGCMVTEGTVFRNRKIRVLRANTVIYEGELESLRRFTDDVQEVSNGTECGIGVRNYNDVRRGDMIEVYETREVARTL